MWTISYTMELNDTPTNKLILNCYKQHFLEPCIKMQNNWLNSDGIEIIFVSSWCPWLRLSRCRRIQELAKLFHGDYFYHCVRTKRYYFFWFQLLFGRNQWILIITLYCDECVLDYIETLKSVYIISREH